MPNSPLIDYAILKWAIIRKLATSAAVDVGSRFTYNAVDYDSLLTGSVVSRDGSLGSGQATIILDNSTGFWNSHHADRINMGNEGVVKMIIGGFAIKLFTGDIMEVEYDGIRVIMKLRDKVNRFMKQRIGSGENPTTVDGFSPGALAWVLLTNDPPNGAGLDDTEDSSNEDIDYESLVDWRTMLTGQGFEVGAEITGQTVKWCLDRIAKMTNTYIWQGGDGRITFAPPRLNGGVYNVNNTENIGLSMITDTIVNSVQIYYNYDQFSASSWPGAGDELRFEDEVNTDEDPPLGGVAADSEFQYGRIPETDDNKVIWNNTEDSAKAHMKELVDVYASPIRIFNITAFLAAFEEDISNMINITHPKYGVSGQTATIESISYDLTTTKVDMQARWAW